MKTILVPLDGSTLAEQILPYVRMLAPILNANVHLLRMIPDAGPDNLLADGLSAVYGVSDPLVSERERQQRSLETLRKQAESYLMSQAALLQGMGLDVAIDVRFGAPADGIVVAAEGSHAALIAMVTHGYSGLRRWTLGSTTDKVVHSTAIPMFVVRGSASPAPSVPKLKRILLPLDGSGLARQAVPFATELAICARAELLPLTVVVPPLSGDPSIVPLYDEALGTLSERLMQELGESAQQLREHQVPITALVESGFAAETIVDVAEERQADLIVIATHGASGLRRWALGSVADKVLHATTTPMVLVRAQISE